jgi:hypothetical protein
MPYQINKHNGDRLVILDDGTLDSTTSLGLVGKNFAGYGEIQNENFLWLLENFAGTIPPGRAIVGQLWYDSGTQRINVYTGANNWKIVGNTQVASAEPTEPAPGDGWLKNDSEQFYVYNGSQFVFVGPEAVQGFGVSRAVSTKIRDDANNYWPVIKLTLNDTVIAIVADRAFNINSLDAVVGFTSLVKGINLSSTAVISGSLQGNSSTTTRLQTARRINGINFDGTSDVVVTANTTNLLKGGNFLIGNDFNGSAETTWNVNGTSNNTAGTLVARDSTGNFRAGTITADLSGNTNGTHFGNVSGNVSGNVIGNLTGNVIGNLTGNVLGDLAGNVQGNVVGDLRGNVLAIDTTIAYNATTKTFFGNFQGTATTANKLTAPALINGVPFDGTGPITVVDSTKLPLTGGVLTGSLRVIPPTVDNDASTKKYVDDRDVVLRADIFANLPPNYTITYGNTTYADSYSNQVGSFNNSTNIVDVFPPTGKSMSDLEAFIPSIAVVHYAGRVDGNDSIRCVYEERADRIRVWVQNTEQRSTPAANWLAIWR